jgi:hypothetical protein
VSSLAQKWQQSRSPGRVREDGENPPEVIAGKWAAHHEPPEYDGLAELVNLGLASRFDAEPHVYEYQLTEDGQAIFDKKVGKGGGS